MTEQELEEKIADRMSKVGRKEKKPNEITLKELISLIRKNNIDIGVSLTKEQMLEASYGLMRALKVMLSLFTNKEDLVIRMGDLGKITYKKRKGKLKGEKRKTPKDFYSSEMVEYTLEEDEGDWLIPWFEFSPSLKEEIKTTSRAEDLKRRAKNGE